MKKIILLLLMITYVSAEIMVIKESPRMRNPETKISFRDNHVTIKKEKTGMFDTGYYVFATYSYEEYLTKSCSGRKYTIISANFGNSYYSNFVINCIE